MDGWWLHHTGSKPISDEYYNTLSNTTWHHVIISGTLVFELAPKYDIPFSWREARRVKPSRLLQRYT